MAAFGAKEFGDLGALETEDAVVHVDRVNYDEDIGGSFAAGDGFEGSDGLRRFVVEQSEVLLLEIGDGRARFGADHNVEEDLIRGERARRRSLLRGLFRGGRAGGKKNGKNQAAEGRGVEHALDSFGRTLAGLRRRASPGALGLNAGDIDAERGYRVSVTC